MYRNKLLSSEKNFEFCANKQSTNRGAVCVGDTLFYLYPYGVRDTGREGLEKKGVPLLPVQLGRKIAQGVFFHAHPVKNPI